MYAIHIPWITQQNEAISSWICTNILTYIFTCQNKQKNERIVVKEQKCKLKYCLFYFGTTKGEEEICGNKYFEAKLWLTKSKSQFGHISMDTYVKLTPSNCCNKQLILFAIKPKIEKMNKYKCRQNAYLFDKYVCLWTTLHDMP